MVDLLESELYNSLLASPGKLVELIPDPFDDWVILDEIQRVPELLSEVHRLIEQGGVKFVMTESSARDCSVNRKLAEKYFYILYGFGLIPGCGDDLESGTWDIENIGIFLKVRYFSTVCLT